MLNFFIGLLVGGFFGFMVCAIIAATAEDRKPGHKRERGDDNGESK